MKNEDQCPNCKIELEIDFVSAFQTDGVVVKTTVEYCPECLYIHYTDVRLEKW